MNWESFDWTTLLWIGGIILLIVFMMWGCGGMMRGGGCCGMGGRPSIGPRGGPQRAATFRLGVSTERHRHPANTPPRTSRERNETEALRTGRLLAC